jgi:hypothetical protein
LYRTRVGMAWLIVVDYRQRRRRLAPRGCFWRRSVLARNCGPNGLVRNWRRSLVVRNCGPNGLVRNWRWSLLVRNCGPRGVVHNCGTFAMASVTDIASPIWQVACRVRYRCCRLCSGSSALGRPLPFHGAFAGGGNLIFFWLRRLCVSGRIVGGRISPANRLGCLCSPSWLRRPVRPWRRTLGPRLRTVIIPPRSFRRAVLTRGPPGTLPPPSVIPRLRNFIPRLRTFIPRPRRPPRRTLGGIHCAKLYVHPLACCLRNANGCGIATTQTKNRKKNYE